MPRCQPRKRCRATTDDVSPRSPTIPPARVPRGPHALRPPAPRDRPLPAGRGARIPEFAVGVGVGRPDRRGGDQRDPGHGQGHRRPERARDRRGERFDRGRRRRRVGRGVVSVQPRPGRPGHADRRPGPGGRVPGRREPVQQRSGRPPRSVRPARPSSPGPGGRRGHAAPRPGRLRGGRQRGRQPIFPPGHRRQRPAREHRRFPSGPLRDRLRARAGRRAGGVDGRPGPRLRPARLAAGRPARPQRGPSTPPRSSRDGPSG